MDFETGRIKTLAEMGFTERGRSLLGDAKSENGIEERIWMGSMCLSTRGKKGFGH